MMHRHTSRYLFVAVTLLMGVASMALAADKRPNIIFIFSDDHAYQAVSAYGYEIGKFAPTPHIDRIAKEGMLFRECYVTNSICGPMRAVIQTGKYSHLNGFIRNGNKFDGDQQTFPKLLQKAGYQTAVIGKWHLGTHQAPQGYDYSEVLMGQGPYYNPPMLKDAKGTGDNDKRERINHTGYTTHIIGDLTLEWLKNGRDPNKPFMLMTQHKAPHRNWQPGPEYLTLFDDVTMPEPPTLFENYDGRPTAVKKQDMTIVKTMNASDLKLRAPGNLTKEQREKWDAAYGPKNEAFEKAQLQGDDLVRWKYQRYVKDYLRCIRSVDDQVGRILAWLDESGLAENTIVIYCSDQGFYLGEHGWFDKRWIYEESLRTPLVVRWPGVIKPGSVNSDIVSPLDFAETFLEIAGAPKPDDMQGESLVPILTGKTPDDWRKTHYYHYYEFPGAHSVHKHYGVVDGRYKLIYFYEDDEWELIDLKVDPLETKNFINDPSYADVKAKLTAELKRLREKYEVPEEDPAGSGGGRGKPDRKKPDKAALLKITPKQAFAAAAPDGKAHRSVDPSMTTLTVSATVTPEASDGVAVAQGGASYGYALYIKDGKPRFAVRDADTLREVVGKSALPTGKTAHLAGVIDADEKLHLYVNGEPVATAKGHLITQFPADALTTGQDAGSLVGDYASPTPFKGKVTDIRIYTGVVEEETLTKWAER